jgi:hypothetical protein
VELTYRYEQNVVVRARTAREALELAPDMTTLDLPAGDPIYTDAAIVDPE